MESLKRTAPSNFQCIWTTMKPQDEPNCLSYWRRQALLSWFGTLYHTKEHLCLNKTINDIRENSQIMQGITILLFGDFRQTLPVIPRRPQANEINVCFKRKLHLESWQAENSMRVKIAGELARRRFAPFLLHFCKGTIGMGQNTNISPPNGCGNSVSSIQDLSNHIYAKIKHNFIHSNLLFDRVILVIKNRNMYSINWNNTLPLTL